jgi:hypothetical protein
MLISERGLVKAMKSAYKKAGYTMVSSEEQIILYTKHWYLRADWPQFPAKALALIVEHLECLPDQEWALEIRDGAEPQHVLPDAVGSDVGEWLEGGSQDTATRVPIWFADYAIYQSESGRKCYGVEPVSLGIVDEGTAEQEAALVVEDDRLRWNNAGCEIIIRAARPTGRADDQAGYVTAVWEALEGVDLHQRRGER